MRWLACGESQVPVGSDWLVPREQHRVKGIRFTKRRNEYLLRRCAGKRAVAAALDWPFDEPNLGRIGVLNRMGGAPYAEVDGQSVGMDLSLTDRAGWAVALLGEPGTMASGTIGVDVEIVERRSVAFVADYFTSAEQDYAQSRADEHGEDGWQAAANLIWSAKEAALKVLRVGLRADTRVVEVSVDHAARPDGWAALQVSAPGGAVFPGWWRRDGVYLLTIAHRRESPPPTPLAGSADLADAAPVHSWMAKPTVD